MVGSTGPSRTRWHGGALGGLLIALLAVVALVGAAAIVHSNPSPAAATTAASAATTAAAAATTAGITAAPTTAGPAVPDAAADWPVYHLNPGRTGDYPGFPTFTGSLVKGWTTALDGAVYAEPLVVNGTVIAATEGDSVYAIDPATGAILWHRNLGTPVRLSTLPCGNIDPLGITGTPAFLINGYFISGAQPYPKFKKLIDRALSEAK